MHRLYDCQRGMSSWQNSTTHTVRCSSHRQAVIIMPFVTYLLRKTLMQIPIPNFKIRIEITLDSEF